MFFFTLAADWSSQHLSVISTGTSKQPVWKFSVPPVVFRSIWVMASWSLYVRSRSIAHTCKQNILNSVSQQRKTGTINLIIPS